MLLLGNFRFAVRILRRNPSFAASAIVVMALGIGASTAVFSVLKGVLLTPLPFHEPGRVVVVDLHLGGVAGRGAQEPIAEGDRLIDVAADHQGDGA